MYNTIQLMFMQIHKIPQKKKLIYYEMSCEIFFKNCLIELKKVNVVIVNWVDYRMKIS
jgi:hypothetical protein